MLLCEEGELSDGMYFDAAAARCVSIDHVGAKITGTSDLEEKHRDAQVWGTIYLWDVLGNDEWLVPCFQTHAD